MALQLSVLKFPDADRIKAEISKHLSTTSPQGWVLLKYSAPTTVVLQEASDGRVPEFLSLLQDDQVQYVLIRLPGDTLKDILITWVGPKVGKIERGKKSEHIGDIMKVLQPSHVQLTAFTKRGFTEDKVRELSDPSSGTHVLKADDDTEQVHTLQADQLHKKSIEEKKQTVVQQKEQERQKVVASVVTGEMEKLAAVSVIDRKHIDTELAFLLDKNNLKGWILLRYQIANTIAFQASGRGSVDEALPLLEDNTIQYLLLRIPASSESVPKDVFIQWIGPKVSKIQQAKTTEHLADLKTILRPAHVEITAFTKQGFTEEKVRALADPTAGTHIIRAD